MRKALLDYQSVYVGMLLLLVSASVAGLYFLKEYTGNLTNEVNAEAGTITTILVDDRRATVYWAGIYGLVFSQTGFNEVQSATLVQGEISASTFVFDCQDPSISINEMYVGQNSTFDFDNLRAGSVRMIDSGFLNLTEDTKERANNTFIFNESVLLGGTNISGIPAVYTYVRDAPNYTLFMTGILNESGRLAFVIRVHSETKPSFKSSIVDYQGLLPVINSTTWYFFRDPNDDCPAGFGSGQIGDAVISGYVFESGTTTPLTNVSISAGGNTSLTDSSGAFNLTVAGGVSHNLVAIKEGYITNITIVNTTIGVTSYRNVTMSRFFGFVNANSTVYGYVRDNSTGSIISGATVSLSGLNTISNSTGNYSFRVPFGNYTIAAVYSGYDSFVGGFSIANNRNLSYIINMTQAAVAGAAEINGTIVNNGTVQGYARDSATNISLQGVTVTVAGNSNITNASGFYNLTALSGTTNLVAVKSGYENYFAEIDVSANNITFHNFTMDEVTVVTGIGNGSVSGTVTTTEGSVLSDVSVSIVGITNISNSLGTYNLSRIPQGTHNLVATRDGYSNYIAQVNVTAGSNTVHNIEMETVTESGLGSGLGAGAGAGSGAGAGAGLGAGRGAGTGVPAQIQQPTEIVDYELSMNKIIKKLRIGNFITVPIGIKNHKEDSVDISFSFEGAVEQLSRLDKERMIIDGSSSGELMLTLLGNVAPGVYEGNLVISGDINQKIPMYILVMDKERISVESLLIKINPVKRKLPAGDDFKYTVDLQNLLSEEKYKVALTYTIEGINTNRSIFLEKEEFVIHTSYSLLKTFRIPEDFKVGDYVLKVEAEFLDDKAEAATIFTVVIPFYRYAVFGIIPMWIIMMTVGTFSTGTFGYYYVKKKMNEKKRYKIELDINALPKAGPRSAYVGQVAETKTKTFFDLDIFQVHTVVAGSSGSGKSVVAQVLVEEALLRNVAVVVFDPTAQWTGFLRRLEDKKLLGLYPTFGMKKTDARPFNGNVHQVMDGRQQLEFSKTFKLGEVNVYVTNKLEIKDVETLVSNTIKEIFHAHLPESKELKYLLIYDGIHSLLPKFGGSGSVFVQIERATREFRKWGVGLILVSQVLSDFPPEVMANINTEIQLRTRDENDLNRAKEKYGESILQSMVKAAAATGVVQNSNYNKGKPYFVTFRPPMHGVLRISEEDLENYNKYNDIVEDVEYQLEQLERSGVDVFDLKLELKLAQDKVKSGNFNMVAIYLDGLTPRIAQQWDKIGKKPQKREAKFYKEGELEGELEKAKGKQKAERDSKEAKDDASKKETEKLGEESKDKKEAKTGEKESQKETKESANKEGLSENNDAVSEAIKKAKEARQKAFDAAHPKSTLSPSEQQINALYLQVKKLVDANNKKDAAALYGKVQDIYKLTPKEQKARILERARQIQGLLK